MSVSLAAARVSHPPPALLPAATRFALRPDDGGPRGAAVRARGERPPTTSYVGTLTVDAAPAGEVLLNRRHVGRTPVRLENLRAGSHLIWIEREGYRRCTRVVPGMR